MGVSIDNKMVVFSCLIILCATPLSLCSRLLHQKSESLFHELGFDASMEELSSKIDVASSLRKAPGGPDPLHNFSHVPVSSKDVSLETSPHKIDVGSSFREIPSGPNPLHD